LRIIAGHFKGRNLKSPATLDTRPTSDRLRETLFNILTPEITDARFLDLCAGSGAIGIEALSRGAAHATFVDRSKKMRALIKGNLALCKASPEDFEVVTADAVDFLRKASHGKSAAWNIVFYDPPYSEDYLGVLDTLGDTRLELLRADGMLVVEHHHKTDLPESVDQLVRYRILKQGESALSFFRKTDE